MIVKFCKAPSVISSDFQGNFPSIHTARDYFSSRTALKLALVEQNQLFNSREILDLDIHNHHYLIGHPEILVSMAHTKEYGVAAIHTNLHARSIGVDIELTSRPFKREMLRMIKHELDQEPEELLPYWVMKEACFKAAYPLYCDKKEKALVLKDVWIKDGKFGIFNDSNPIGEVTISKRVEFDCEFWLALALI